MRKNKQHWSTTALTERGEARRPIEDIRTRTNDLTGDGGDAVGPDVNIEVNLALTQLQSLIMY